MSGGVGMGMGMAADDVYALPVLQTPFLNLDNPPLCNTDPLEAFYK
jgi:hypothetical protein